MNKSFGRKIAAAYLVLFLAVFLASSFLIPSPARKLIVIVFSIGAIAVLGLAMFIGKYLARRVRQLKSAAKQFALGDLSREIDVVEPDEFGDLAEAMNEMAARLQERIQEIEKEKSKNAAILQNMSEGVIAVDRDGRILMVNESAEKIFDIDKNQATGRIWFEAVRNKEIWDVLQEAIQKQKRVSIEVALTHPLPKVLQIHAIGISRQEDQVCGILVISDMTEINRLENLRREFVANVSHELKTPLTSMQGFIELLLGEAGEEKTRREHFLKIIEEDAARLGRLIDDLLELSKIESRELELKIEIFDIAPLVDDVLVLFEKQRTEKGIVLENRIPKAALRVQADRDRVKQVLLNLVDNAVKFNRERGKVIVQAGPAGGMARISIEDTGHGIPEASIPRIFERFYRVDKARARESGDTGLGLSIVKHIVESHGGAVSCESVLGKGSVFSFTIPLTSNVAFTKLS